MFDLPKLADAARKFLADNLAGTLPRKLVIIIPDGIDDPAYFTIPRSARPSIIHLQDGEERDEIFVPDPFQTAILTALEGKALRTDALASVVGDRSRLFRKPTGGIPELRKEGLVDHHSRLGYYRPDAPPPELAG